MLCCSAFCVILALGLSSVSHIVLGYDPSITSFFRYCYHERMLDFIRGFFYICVGDCMILVLASVSMLHCIYRFVYVELSFSRAAKSVYT
jgi:hypothetical protein